MNGDGGGGYYDEERNIGVLGEMQNQNQWGGRAAPERARMAALQQAAQR